MPSSALVAPEVDQIAVTAPIVISVEAFPLSLRLEKISRSALASPPSLVPPSWATRLSTVARGSSTTRLAMLSETTRLLSVRRLLGDDYCTN